MTKYQPVYVPDHSLKKAWSPELEDTQPSQLPYGLVYELDTKKLIYAAVSSANPIKGDALITSLLNTWKPQIILVQGHAENEIHPSQVKFKVHDIKTILKGASATPQQIRAHLATYGIDERDHEIHKVICLMNQVWQFETQSFKDLKQKTIDYLETELAAKNLRLTFEDISRWFENKMGCPLTETLIFDSIVIAPQDPKLPSTNYLQKLSSYEDEVDDAVAMEKLAKALDMYDMVMIIRAGSKYVTERELLHKLLGVSGPMKVVNLP